jgi:hypothetical protein
MPVEKHVPAVLVKFDQRITPTEVRLQMDETYGHLYWCEGDYWPFLSFDLHKRPPLQLRTKRTDFVVFS